MRLLLINPNTSSEITDKVVTAARRVAAPGTEIVGLTGRFGARYISDRASSAIAAHSALDAYASYDAPHDAVVLACFGDPGLLALREISPKPVIGMAEASIHAACAGDAASRFGIVTGGRGWVSMLEEFVASLGKASRLAVVKAIEKTGGAVAAEPDAALADLGAACEACVAEHGADVVILGGAGLAGLAARLRGKSRVPLIDGVEAVVRRAEAVVSGAAPIEQGTNFAAPAESVGLAPGLAAMLRGTARAGG